MTEQLEGQMSLFDLDIWCGRTYLEPCQAETPKAKTSASSSKKPRESATKMPLFLDLRGNGGARDASWEMGGALLGAFSMHSFGEQPSTLMAECGFPALPNGVGVSRLSQILTDTPLPKYYLSAKACLGILNRAQRRGKELPEELREALENQASPSKLGGGCEVDSSGKKAGKGLLMQTELAATVSAVQDQHLLDHRGGV